MLIPLWLPWTLTFAALLHAALSPRDDRGGPDLGRRALVVVAVAVALGLSVDRYAVSEQELYDATAYAAALADGTAGAATPRRIGAVVEDRLGREPTFRRMEPEEDARPGTRVDRYEVTIGDFKAAVCLEVRDDQWQDEPPVTHTGTFGGRCQ